MAVNSNKKNILIAGLVIVFSVIVVQLFKIQIIDKEYKINAANNALIYRVKYPVRGLIYDRNHKILVSNKNTYDILVTPYEVSAFDTLTLCEIFEIDTQYVKETFDYYRQNRRRIGYQSQTLLKQVSAKQYSLFLEKSYQFPGFSGVSRTARDYPYNAGGNLLGYINEVDANFLKTHPEYKAGDYTGRTGMEQRFESLLRGEKGYNIYLRDVHNKIHSSYEEGAHDKAAIAGKDVISTIDAELQNYGELLMSNKIGSIVAIEPETGEILTMVSSPGINVSQLSEINKHYAEIAANPYKPLYNRAVMSPYPPGSVFKLVNALIGLQEGVITPNSQFPCSAGFKWGRTTVGCHWHKSPTNLIESIMMSCNSYYCYTFKNILENPRYGSTQSALNRWKMMVESFGFGVKLGSDFPSEQAGNVPSSEYYNKEYNNRWDWSTVISLSIGQGELGCTPLHLANLAAILANRGYYYIPHIFKGTSDGTVMPEDKYYEKHHAMVDPSYFEIIADGMHKTVNLPAETGATGWRAAVEGLDICGKTGTAQNPHGDDHSVFLCFAPKDNPKIAVAVYIEHASWGSNVAASISGLIIEKYLNGEISESRKEMEQRMTTLKLMNTHNNIPR